MEGINSAVQRATDVMDEIASAYQAIRHPQRSPAGVYMIDIITFMA